MFLRGHRQTLNKALACLDREAGVFANVMTEGEDRIQLMGPAMVLTPVLDVENLPLHVETPFPQMLISPQMNLPSSQSSEDTDINFKVQYTSPEDSTSSSDDNNYTASLQITQPQPRTTLIPIQEEMTPLLLTETSPHLPPNYS
uniref:Uncharacterized protein n=1 Tax=Moniliophthora roreri TaxID=221103 RepID=A0A0W0G247_MONRR